jgi:hypothetical protein
MPIHHHMRCILNQYPCETANEFRPRSHVPGLVAVGFAVDAMSKPPEWTFYPDHSKRSSVGATLSEDRPQVGNEMTTHTLIISFRSADQR